MSVSVDPKLARVRGDSDALEFLPAALELAETPPPPLRRVLALLIGLFFVIALVWAGFSPIDIIAVADGKTVPVGQTKTVQTFQAGVVIAINVQEGDEVGAGDVLVELDQSETHANLRRAELDLKQAQINEAINAALLTTDPSTSFVVPPLLESTEAALANELLTKRWRAHQSALDQNHAERGQSEAELQALEAESISLQAMVEEFNQLNQSMAKLDNLGLTTRSQGANIRMQLLSTKSELQRSEQAKFQTNLAIERLDFQKQQLVSVFESEASQQLSDARHAIRIANNEVERYRERATLQIIRAPVSGTINEVNITTIGAVVTSSETLMTIVPKDTPIEVEAVLFNKDIGFVEVGQTASLKFEAFPFTRFGVLKGVVSHVARDAVIDPQRGPVFKVRVQPNMDHIRIGQREIGLGPGMRTTVEIQTGHRTVLEFFLTPILRYKDEAIRER